MQKDTFTVLTYNVYLNKAMSIVPEILEKYKPDLVCLQEVYLSKKNLGAMLIPNYRVASSSTSFYKMGKSFGQVNMYRNDAFAPLESKSIFLPRANYEVVISLITRSEPRTALCTEFVSQNSDHDQILVCNLHLTALQATNSARKKQLCETLESIDMSPNQRVLVLGDLNYPFRRRSLEQIIHTYNLSEATSNIVRTYASQPWSYIEKTLNHVFPVSLKYDYIFHTQALRCVETQVLSEYKNSDHQPVLTRLSIV